MVLIGKKKKMTRLYIEDTSVPCTIVDLSGNLIAKKNDSGYTVGMGVERNIGKQKLGIFRKLGFVPKYTISDSQPTELEVGSKVEVDAVCKVGEKLTLHAISKGRGFAGVMKRWGMKGGKKTRGQGITQRHQGSIGSQTPGKVWKGKHMAGRMGSDMVTYKNVEILKIEGSTVWLKGVVPGGKENIVYIYKK